MKSTKKLLIVLIIVFVFIALVVLIKTKLIWRILDDLVLDNKEHYLSCEELPSIDEVKQVINEHQNILQEIEQVNPGSVFVTTGNYEDCIDKSDIVISYPSHQNRLKIEEIINGKTFFGVPYRLQNM